MFALVAYYPGAPDQLNPGQLNPDNSTHGQLNPGQLNPDNSTHGQLNPGQLNPDNSTQESQPTDNSTHFW
uniref:Uncharacterized protein n=1 Tax=Acrobeloides nanus TaxID=290746 RepID=A0A914EE23_9BILA